MSRVAAAPSDHHPSSEPDCELRQW